MNMKKEEAMTTINETLKMLPPEAKQEVVDFAEFIAQKYIKNRCKVYHPKERILKLAGAWKDMHESDFQDFIADIYERREKSFKTRLKKALIDTDILSMYLRGNEKVKSKFEEYLAHYFTINISILSYYEILSGLKHKNANKQLESFLELCEIVSIVPITKESCNKSADIYASLKKSGQIIDDVDILIAGICLEEKFVLVTNNTKHFERIEDIKTVNWSL